MTKATIALTAMLTSVSAFAAEGEKVTVFHPTTGMGDAGLYGIGLAILLGLAVLSATGAQGKVGAAAMEGLARNPQSRNALFVPLIVVLALIESLFILTWIIANQFAGKI